MNRRSDIKRFWKVLLLILVADVAIVGLVEKWDRLFPSREVSELYSRYADVPGIDVSFVKGYRINDTLAVDVTLLQATTDSSWHALLSDFDIPDLYEKKGTDKVFFRLIKKCHTEERPDTANGDNDVLAASPKNRTIGIFHITDKSQIKPIVFHQINKLKKTSS